jgi:peptide-methionine (S)-S-oxide reductase
LQRGSRSSISRRRKRGRRWVTRPWCQRAGIGRRCRGRLHGRLLQVFFSVAHNPTELNYQGPDHGTQYRSAVFPLNADQRSVAQAYIAQLDRAHVFSVPVVTRVEDFKGCYPAEAYHQNFLALHPGDPYIVINDLPKVGNLKRMFPDLYRNDPVLLKTAAS